MMMRRLVLVLATCSGAAAFSTRTLRALPRRSAGLAPRMVAELPPCNIKVIGVGGGGGNAGEWCHLVACQDSCTLHAALPPTRCRAGGSDGHWVRRHQRLHLVVDRALAAAKCGIGARRAAAAAIDMFTRRGVQSPPTLPPSPPPLYQRHRVACRPCPPAHARYRRCHRHRRRRRRH